MAETEYISSINGKLIKDTNAQTSIQNLNRKTSTNETAIAKLKTDFETLETSTSKAVASLSTLKTDFENFNKKNIIDRINYINKNLPTEEKLKPEELLPGDAKNEQIIAAINKLETICHNVGLADSSTNGLIYYQSTSADTQKYTKIGISDDAPVVAPDTTDVASTKALFDLKEKINKTIDSKVDISTKNYFDDNFDGKFNNNFSEKLKYKVYDNEINLNNYLSESITLNLNELAEDIPYNFLNISNEILTITITKYKEVDEPTDEQEINIYPTQEVKLIKNNELIVVYSPVIINDNKLKNLEIETEDYNIVNINIKE